ncbi:hypothetical protein EV648_102468 [Kribbella sp. VKM Ac-2568]|nr:hypothetical protein EV648_102468 [Kribbella sp. VKM Ac-2568]
MGVAVETAVSAPLLLSFVCATAWVTLFGRPVLVVDGAGVSLGRKHLGWQEIQSIEATGGLGVRRRRPSDPRRPVDASVDWFGGFTIVPIAKPRKRQIFVGSHQVKELRGLATWLEALRQVQSASDRSR